MESIASALFIIATLGLLCCGIVVIFFGISADDDSDFPPFLRRKIVKRVVATCLIFIALGFPVIASGNEKFFLASFLLSAVALLAAMRTLLGSKAQWATWAASGLIMATIIFPLVLKRL